MSARTREIVACLSHYAVGRVVDRRETAAAAVAAVVRYAHRVGILTAAAEIAPATTAVEAALTVAAVEWQAAAALVPAELRRYGVPVAGWVSCAPVKVRGRLVGAAYKYADGGVVEMLAATVLPTWEYARDGRRASAHIRSDVDRILSTPAGVAMPATDDGDWWTGSHGPD